MLKKLITHVLIGGAVFLFGAVLHDFAHIRGLGDFLAYSGLFYIGLSVLYIIVQVFTGNNLEKSLVENVTDSISKSKARKELLELKKLLDAEIITQGEFDSKAKELKKKILKCINKF